MTEPTIFELSSPGRKGIIFPKSDVPETKVPANLVRNILPMPEVSEIDVIRHFTRLSQIELLH